MTSEVTRALTALGAALESVASSLSDGRLQLNAARAHLVSEQLVAATDPVAGLTLAYDAARKSVQAFMAAHGLRVKVPPGNHFTFIQVTRTLAWDESVWSDLLWLKDRRNEAEYPAPASRSILLSDAAEAITASAAMVAFVEGLLTVEPD